MKRNLFAFVLALMAASSSLGAEKKSPVVFFEITVSNFEMAKAFYGPLFGWEFQPSTTPDFLYADTGQTQIAGGLALRKQLRPNEEQRVTVYVQTENVEAMVAKAVELGGTVELPATRLPGDEGVIAQVRDKDRNIIGIYAPKVAR